MAPIDGSTMTTVSGESEARSGSAMTPSFIWRRTAKSGSLVTGGAGDRRAARIAGARARFGPGRTPRDWLAGPGSIRGGSAPETASADHDAERVDPRPGRRRRERLLELRAAEAQLLGDDRRVGLDDERRTVEPGDPAGARGARNALRDEPVERRHDPGEAELVLQAEAAGCVWEEVADPRHRPTAAGHATQLRRGSRWRRSRPARITPACPPII